MPLGVSRGEKGYNFNEVVQEDLSKRVISDKTYIQAKKPKHGNVK